MKVIMVMFDSLNRHMLQPYGCDWVKTPNFQRLAEKSVTFDTSYVCSMPCMPARRDWHTARPNFLHRSWSPLEPFDDSVPEILKENGIHSHLASDHFHYWEEGGCNYHTHYKTWECIRGQEGDPWIGQVAPPEIPKTVNKSRGYIETQDWINRPYMDTPEKQPQAITFAKGCEFIHRNKNEDNWFLQIETFDPHEPFFTHKKHKDLYPEHYDHYTGDHFDWPLYRKVQETREEVEHLRYENASLVSMCDEKMGEILDLMDELDLWKDTMLIVWTDHGFLLGEHDCWAKCWMPFYEEVAHTPFFVWDPRSGKKGERRKALVQPAIDLGPTVLHFFGLQPTKDMLGKPLAGAIDRDEPVREAAIFGMHGHQVNVTDGKYVYMRAPATDENQPLYEYTMMPTHMKRAFSADELAGNIELAEPFSFTKGCRTMKIHTPYRLPGGEKVVHKFETLLYDVQNDPRQAQPLDDPEVEKMMIGHMVNLMKECDAPAEQYERLGLTV